ncbi:MAG: ATP-binding protein [Bacteroidetes bacterium]|nr:ATP-binding protein [Bacteroidota bacterium]
MKNFRLNVIIRISILSGTIFLLNYVYNETDLTATLLVITLIFIMQIVLLVKYIDRTNNELTRFILSIKHSDFSQTFAAKSKGKSFSELHSAFNDVMDKFRNTRNEKEENLKYLQTVMQHVGIGLLSYNEIGEIEIINNSAKKILGIPHLKNVITLNKLADNFGLKLMQLRAGDKIIEKIVDKDELIQLLIYATEFKVRNQNYKLISLQNIQSELEEQEMEAWQKLIRVLTHEIMNSITPISSLSATVNDILSNAENDEIQLDAESVTDIRSAMTTINRRSEGLLKFVNNYRNLTRIPKPNFQIIQIRELFENASKLFENQFAEKKIKFVSFVEPVSLELTADRELMEQVLINLMLNAIDSLANTEKPEINLNAQLDTRGKIVIRLIDNGSGIPEEVVEKIFIPFYTTKANGSGIGLSLSRQIIRAHGGMIRVSSTPQSETVFTLRF